MLLFFLCVGIITKQLGGKVKPSPVTPGTPGFPGPSGPYGPMGFPGPSKTPETLSYPRDPF